MVKGGILGFPPLRIPPSTRDGTLVPKRRAPDAMGETWKT
jgi:hypothetical protein